MASPYLNPQEAAAYLRLSSVHSLYTFLYRRRKAGFPVTTYRRNGRLLFKSADLDACLTVEQAPRHLRKAGSN